MYCFKMHHLFHSESLQIQFKRTENNFTVGNIVVRNVVRIVMLFLCLRCHTKSQTIVVFKLIQ